MWELHHGEVGCGLFLRNSFGNGCESGWRGVGPGTLRVPLRGLLSEVGVVVSLWLQLRQLVIYADL